MTYDEAKTLKLGDQFIEGENPEMIYEIVELEGDRVTAKSLYDGYVGFAFLKGMEFMRPYVKE